MPSYLIVWTKECQDDFPGPYAPVCVRDLTISVGTLIKHDTYDQLCKVFVGWDTQIHHQ